MKEVYKFETLAVHAGESPCRVTGALDTPIYQSTTFVSADADEMAAVYGGEMSGLHVHALRKSHHPRAGRKDGCAGGGEAAQAFSSGMAAISSAILGYVRAGDHVVAAQSLYGAAYHFLNTKAPQPGCFHHFCSVHASRGV